MIPLSDENPTLRVPLATFLLLGLIGAAWVFVQGLGFSPMAMARSICELGLVPGELTQKAALGVSIPLGEGMRCVVDRTAINWLTPLTSMFLHGGWAHLLGNCLFLWVFGNNVEDSMGRLRFLAFYVLCGLAAAAAQVAQNPASALPMVGASGAISGVMGAYLVLYPHARVNMLFILFIFIRIIALPAWLVLVWWFALQLMSGLQEFGGAGDRGGVAFAAHVGGFVAGLVAVKLFENSDRVHERLARRPRLRPRTLRF